MLFASLLLSLLVVSITICSLLSVVVITGAVVLFCARNSIAAVVVIVLSICYDEYCAYDSLLLLPYSC